MYPSGTLNQLVRVPPRALDMEEIPTVQDSMSVDGPGNSAHLYELAQDGVGPIIRAGLRGQVCQVTI